MRTIIQWKSLLAVLTFESVDEISWCVQMKATEQYFPVVLFIMLHNVVLTFESVDEILWCYHSNEKYWAILLHDAFCFSVFLQNVIWIFLNFNYQLCTRGSKNQHYSSFLDLPHTTDSSTVWIGSDDFKHRANEKLTVISSVLLQTLKFSIDV